MQSISQYSALNCYLFDALHYKFCDKWTHQHNTSEKSSDRKKIFSRQESNPWPCPLRVLVAQWIERPLSVREVIGSIPVGGSDFSLSQVRVMSISSLFTSYELKIRYLYSLNSTFVSKNIFDRSMLGLWANSSGYCFKCYLFYSLLEVTEKQQQDFEKEAKRSHLVLEKTQKTSEKRERAYKAKVEALEKQVNIWVVFLWQFRVQGRTPFSIPSF